MLFHFCKIFLRKLVRCVNYNDVDCCVPPLILSSTFHISKKWFVLKIKPPFYFAPKFVWTSQVTQKCCQVPISSTWIGNYILCKCSMAATRVFWRQLLRSINIATALPSSATYRILYTIHTTYTIYAIYTIYSIYIIYHIYHIYHIPYIICNIYIAFHFSNKLLSFLLTVNVSISFHFKAF